MCNCGEACKCRVKKIFENGKFVGDADSTKALCLAWIEHLDNRLEIDAALNQFLLYCSGERGSELHDEAVWLLDNGGY